MPTVSILNPIDQPTGRRRLLAELRDCIRNPQFSSFQFIVAYAKSGPLLRLQADLEARLKGGFEVHCVFGLDQQGTTAQALDFALTHFTATYVTQEPNLTFHPKMYAFTGPAAARLFIGSNNLTVGGTETNFEAGVRIDFDLPVDAGQFQPFVDSWNELLPAACPATRVLNSALLGALIADGTVLDEAVIQRSKAAAAAKKGAAPKAPRSGLAIKPPSALPAKKPKVLVPAPAAAAPVAAAAIPAPVAAPIVPYGAQGLAMQIKPHHNGEIFLSVLAIRQNPEFFRWPFTGQTTPKKGSNVAYPQLTPDPVVNISVLGAGNVETLRLSGYPLNTVFYEPRAEIRVTASPLVGIVPDYSVMVMRTSEVPGIDYEITIHRPDSPDYMSWVDMCNQTMPSGGKKPRKFGWF